MREQTSQISSINLGHGVQHDAHAEHVQHEAAAKNASAGAATLRRWHNVSPDAARSRAPFGEE